MKKMYAPWRNDYVTKKDNNEKPLKNNCVFCTHFSQNEDEKNLILKRFSHTALIMNYYPYAAGHLMALPLKHHAQLDAMTQQERAQLMEVTAASANIVEKELTCDGINIGINLGKAGGGRIPEHLHVHIVPRWNGDTNFLTTVADTRLICSDFHDIYHQLKKHCEQLAC